MAVVTVHGKLKELAGGSSEHKLNGATVVELLRELEQAHPGIGGWILDERGVIRQHINLYVNGEPANEDTEVDENGRVEVLPAISGG